MKKILVVEDELRIAELLKKGLEEFGYIVTLAFDGEMYVFKLKFTSRT